MARGSFSRIDFGTSPTANWMMRWIMPEAGQEDRDDEEIHRHLVRQVVSSRLALRHALDAVLAMPVNGACRQKK